MISSSSFAVLRSMDMLPSPPESVRMRRLTPTSSPAGPENEKEGNQMRIQLDCD